MTDVDSADDHDHDTADDEVVFELGDWTEQDRALLVTRLNEQHIAHVWEDGDLVVAEVDADKTDDAIEAVEYPDELAESDDADDDGAGYAVMSALFDASDRLQNDPADQRAAADFEEASGMAGTSAPPFGLDAEVWRQVQELAAQVVTQMDEDADDDVIARDAAALRHLLANYV